MPFSMGWLFREHLNRIPVGCFFPRCWRCRVIFSPSTDLRMSVDPKRMDWYGLIWIDNGLILIWIWIDMDWYGLIWIWIWIDMGWYWYGYGLIWINARLYIIYISINMYWPTIYILVTHWPAKLIRRQAVIEDEQESEVDGRWLTQGLSLLVSWRFHVWVGMTFAYLSMIWAVSLYDLPSGYLT